MMAGQKSLSEQKGEWMVLTGNHATSHAARLARAQVIPSYPITPQTTIVELISELIADGQMDARMIRVESEHSAMAAAIGASSVGARVFTASASHGILLMHEMLHWAAGARTPIGMAVVNRAIGPPWNIHVDHQDAISQRDTGWMTVFVSSNQEALDSMLVMYKVAENAEVLLPFMVCLDAFVLSHTYMPVRLPAQEEVDDFLPPYHPPHYKMDPQEPITFSPIVRPNGPYQEMRWSVDQSMLKALSLFEEFSEEYRDRFGSGHDHGGAVHEYNLDDAEYAIVTAGTLASEAEVAGDQMRARGERVGLLKIRLYRPFPVERVRKALEDKVGVVAIDRSISFGFSGPIAEDVKAALYGSNGSPPVVGYVTGLGGRDITAEDIMAMALDGVSKIGTGETRDMVTWHKLRG